MPSVWFMFLFFILGLQNHFFTHHNLLNLIIVKVHLKVSFKKILSRSYFYGVIHFPNKESFAFHIRKDTNKI